jgi:hypothetical protein
MGPDTKSNPLIVKVLELHAIELGHFKSSCPGMTHGCPV